MLYRRVVFVLFCFSFVLMQGQNASNTKIKQDNDTVLQKVFYFHASKTDYALDTLYRLSNNAIDIHYYDPMLNPKNSYYQYLSLMGTPALDLIYNSDDLLNYQRQPNNYQPYVFTKGNVKYFQNKKAYSAFTYDAGTDAQQYFNVIFARNLYKGLNLQTEYSVNYADGNLNNSQVMNQFFNIGVNYISDKGRYRSNAAFIHSRAYILENGGILNDTMFVNSEYSSMQTYPTYLNSGWSKWKTNEFYFNQSVRIAKDSTLNLGAFVHSVSYEKYARLYTDENKTSLDSLATTLQRNSLYWTNVTKPQTLIPVHLGLNYDVITFRDSLEKKHFNVLSPEARVGFKGFVELRFIQSFSDNLYDKDNQFDVVFNHLFALRSKKDSSIVFDSYIKAQVQNKQADYIYSHYLTDSLAWDYNNTGKTKTKSISFGVEFRKNITLELSYFDIKDRYYFDENLVLYKGNAKLYQVNLKNDFNIHRFSFRGLLSFQKVSDEDVVRLPLLSLKQSVFYNFALMKGKLPMQVGLDINYNTAYYADKYNTSTGMFVRQNSMKIGNHVYADVFVTMRVQRFTMFASFLHVSSFLQSHDYFNSPLYPHNGFAFRYGISWKFLD